MMLGIPLMPKQIDKIVVKRQLKDSFVLYTQHIEVLLTILILQ